MARRKDFDIMKGKSQNLAFDDSQERIRSE